MFHISTLSTDMEQMLALVSVTFPLATDTYAYRRMRSSRKIVFPLDRYSVEKAVEPEEWILNG